MTNYLSALDFPIGWGNFKTISHIVIPMILRIPLSQVTYYYHTNQQDLDYCTYTVKARFHRRSPLVIKVPIKPVEGVELGTLWEVLLGRLSQTERHNLNRILKLKKYKGINQWHAN